MTSFGKIIVIKRNGLDGAAFPLSSTTCLIGRGSHCDIRIQLGTVSEEHSRMDVNPDGQILLTNLSKLNPTTLNNHPVKNSVHVCHMDIITVADRSLRWEFPANSQYYKNQMQESPGKGSSPKAKNLALNSPKKLSPDGKSPPGIDHRSFKVSLSTPHHSPGKRSLQKPLSGKKVPFFLTPKPGKHSAKKTLSYVRGYLSPEKASNSRTSPARTSSIKTSPSPKVRLGNGPPNKLATPRSRKNTPTPVKMVSPKAALAKTPSPKSVKKASLSPKTPSPKIALKKTPSPKAKSPAKTGTTSPKGPSPNVRRASKSISPSTSLKGSPQKTGSKVSPKSATKPASRSRASLSAKKSPVNKRKSDSGFISRGGRLSQLSKSGPSARSLRVSFGPNLSPEQFDRALPPTTPLRKGGKPMRKSLTSPNYYGNPIISPDKAPKSAKRSASPAAVSPKAKKARAEKQLPVSAKKSPSSKAPSSRQYNLNKRKSASLNSSGSTSPNEDRRASIAEENVVKIFSPASPDSKKSAALRTIHAKLVLNKNGKKRDSESPFNIISPASAKRELLAKSRKSDDSSISDFAKLSASQSKRSTLDAASANSSFDMQSLQTPCGPNEMLVSPMTAQRGASPSFLLKRMMRASPSPRSRSSTSMIMRSSGKCDIAKAVKAVKKKSRFPVKSPKSDYTDVRGVKRLMKTPRKSPKSDYTDVEGVKRLMKSPRKSPKSDYTDVEGVKRLMKSPRKSPMSDYTNVEGVSRLFRGKQKSPKSDYTNVKGVKRMFRQQETPQTLSPESVACRKFYPNRVSKVGPVNYLGFEKETSPRNSSPLTPMEKQTLSTLMKTLSPSSKENLVDIISSTEKKSFVLKRLSADTSLTPSSAKKLSATRVSSIKKSPNLKRLSFSGSPTLRRVSTNSPLKSRSLGTPGTVGRSSKSSLSPTMNKLFLTPVVSKLLSPRKKSIQSPLKAQASSSSSPKISPVPALRTSMTPISKASPKSLADTPSKVTPVLRIATSSGKSSGNKRVLRSARSARKPVKYSPGSPILKRKGVRATKMTPLKTSPASPVKSRIGKLKKAKIAGSPKDEDDEPVSVSPKVTPVRRTRKAKTGPKSAATSKSPSLVISPKKRSLSPGVKSSPKKGRATKKSKVVVLSPERSTASPINTSPSLSAKKTRGRLTNKRKAEPFPVSPKAVTPPKKGRRVLASATPATASPVNSPSTVAVRNTRTKASKARASPKDVKSPAKKSKTAVTSAEGTPTATPRRGRLPKGKTPKSPKVETPTAVLPRKTRRGAAKKATPAKEETPKASPVARRRKATNKSPSPAKAAVATRSSRRAKK